MSPGQSIDVELLDVAKGGTIDLDRVLLIADGEKITVGSPVVEGAKVVATSQGDSKADKVIIFKYRAKKRYYKKTGHRQPFTTLAIDKIIGPGLAEAEPVKKARRASMCADQMHDGTRFSCASLPQGYPRAAQRSWKSACSNVTRVCPVYL